LTFFLIALLIWVACSVVFGLVVGVIIFEMGSDD